MFPQVNVVTDKIITYESGIYTSGGAYSYLNLLLCLIEKFTDREMSVLVSKMFEIEIERKRQAPLVIFQGQKDHDDEPIRKAQEFIENNFDGWSPPS
jgi:transcriptional regulator GlxA family with amidase domain